MPVHGPYPLQSHQVVDWANLFVALRFEEAAGTSRSGSDVENAPWAGLVGTTAERSSQRAQKRCAVATMFTGSLEFPAEGGG